MPQSRLLRFYVAAVAVVASIAAALLLVTGSWELERAWLVAAIAAFAALDPLFSVKLGKRPGQAETRGHEEAVLVFAALLLPPVFALAAFVIGVAIGELAVRRGALKGTFNVAQFACSAALGLAIVQLAGYGEPDVSAGRMVAVLVGALVFAVANQLLIAGVLALATGDSFRRELLDDLHLAAIVWAGNTSAGLLAGLAALAYAWALPFASAALIALGFSFSGHARALRHRQMLTELVDWSWDGIFSVDATGRVRLWNPAMEALVGLQAAAVTGTTLTNVLKLRDEEGLPADTFLAPHAGAPAEDRVVRLDSTEGVRWLRVSRSAVPDSGFSFIARDITHDREAQEALRGSEERLRLALSAGSMGWWEWDLQSGDIRCSEGLERIFGVGALRRYQDVLAAIHPDDRASAEQTIARALAGGDDTFVHRIVRPDGNVRWVEAKGRVVTDVEGKPRGMIGVASDVTERKRLEADVVHSQKTDAVGRLAAGIAHDFNNLMSAVIGFSELVLGRLQPDDPLRAHVEQIAGAGRRAATMTQQLLAFSSKQALSPSSVDLAELVMKLEKLLARVLTADVALDISADTQLGAVYADPGQLEQVVMNLVINARDAMPEGGELTVRAVNVEIEESTAVTDPPLRAGSYVRLSVSDTGSGIDEETRKRIFEPFFTTKARDKGTGLGLSTVAAIIKDAGGAISVASTVGAGTTFDIYLPHVAKSAEARAQAGTDQPPPRGFETILLVEDAEGMRMLERVILEECGYKVLEAENVQHALEVTRSCEDDIHLLLTDVVMPHSNGPELAERLSALRPDMKVLYASGYAQDELARYDLRGRPLLTKPVTPDALARTVRDTLDASDGAYAHTRLA